MYMRICVYKNVFVSERLCAHPDRYVCVYEKMCADMCIGVNENMCLYAKAYVPVSGRYVSVYEKMRVDMSSENMRLYENVCSHDW